MADYTVTIIVLTVAVAVAILLYLVFPRIKGLHFTSRLTCPKCHKQFDYNWVPGGSFSAIRLGTERYIRCPNCHSWATLDLLATQIKQNQTSTTKESNSR